MNNNLQYKNIEKIISRYKNWNKKRKVIEKITFLNSKSFLKEEKTIISNESHFARTCWKGLLKFNKIISQWKISNNCPFLIKGIKTKKFINLQKKRLKKFVARNH